MSFLLAFCVFFPMAGAVISYLLGRYQKKIRDYFADGVTIATFGVMLFLTVNILSVFTCRLHIPGHRPASHSPSHLLNAVRNKKCQAFTPSPSL